MSTQNRNSEKAQIGIALSGGAAKGFAHVGVLKALEECGIKPEIISGTSMGALIGVLYAEGYSSTEIGSWILDHPVLGSIKFAWNKSGLFKLDKVQELLESKVPHNSFSKLKREFYVSVSNLSKGRSEILNSGKLIDSVLASCSIPVVFEPRKIKKDIYADGGLFNNLPTKVLRNKCKILIGVNVNHVNEAQEINGIWDVANRTFSLSVEENAKPSKLYCDLLIEPNELAKISLWEFKKAEEIMKIGYDHTKELLLLPFAKEVLNI
jgi:NTE family protein